MAHLSETKFRLERKTARLQAGHTFSLPSPEAERAAVWLVVLPDGESPGGTLSAEWTAALERFRDDLRENSVLCVLAAPRDAAALVGLLERRLKFQLWVAIKRRSGDSTVDAEGSTLKRERQTEGLPHTHTALLVFTVAGGPLRHAVTRIGYDYCPACDKTTRDYGGKKHLYHEFGTLLSDVWRDVVLEPGDFPEPVVDRLQDLFAVEPWHSLLVVDARGSAAKSAMPARAPAFPRPTSQASPGNSPIANRVGLLHGDSLDILTSLPAESVDFCFADPPYNINKKYDRWNDSREIRDYFAWCDRWLGELARVLKPGRTLAVLNIPLWAVRHFEFLSTVLDFQTWIAWDGLSLPVRKIMPAHYAIVCFSKGRPRPLPGLSRKEHSALEAESLRALRQGYCLRASCVARRRARGVVDTEPIGDLWWDIHRLKHNSRRDDHPCQLPPALMRRLISLFTYEGEIVLDPFNGVATTTLAAAQLGRRYIGIELSKEYHETALRRHALLDAGGDPFAKRGGNDIGATHKAKNSRVQRLAKRKYEVSKKTLQLEVKRIAARLGRMPTREDVRRETEYKMEYYEEYFIDWGEVCAAARTTGMTENKPSTEG